MLPHNLNAFTHVYSYNRKVPVAVWASLKLGHFGGRVNFGTMSLYILWCGGMTVVAWIKDGKMPFDAHLSIPKNFVKTDALAVPKILRAFIHTMHQPWICIYEYMNIRI